MTLIQLTSGCFRASFRRNDIQVIHIAWNSPKYRCFLLICPRNWQIENIDNPKFSKKLFEVKIHMEVNQHKLLQSKSTVCLWCMTRSFQKMMVMVMAYFANRKKSDDVFHHPWLSFQLNWLIYCINALYFINKKIFTLCVL